MFGNFFNSWGLEFFIVEPHTDPPPSSHSAFFGELYSRAPLLSPPLLRRPQQFLLFLFGFSQIEVGHTSDVFCTDPTSPFWVFPLFFSSIRPSRPSRSVHFLDFSSGGMVSVSLKMVPHSSSLASMDVSGIHNFLSLRTGPSHERAEISSYKTFYFLLILDAVGFVWRRRFFFRFLLDTVPLSRLSVSFPRRLFLWLLVEV